MTSDRRYRDMKTKKRARKRVRDKDRKTDRSYFEIEV
jgi:hypothetical protein